MSDEIIAARMEKIKNFLNQRWVFSTSFLLSSIFLAILIYITLTHIDEVSVANVCHACMEQNPGIQCYDWSLVTQ